VIFYEKLIDKYWLLF